MAEQKDLLNRITQLEQEKKIDDERKKIQRERTAKCRAKKKSEQSIEKKVVPTVVEENPPIEDVPDLDLDSEISSEREEIFLLTQKLEKRKEHLKQLLTLKKLTLRKKLLNSNTFFYLWTKMD